LLIGKISVSWSPYVALPAYMSRTGEHLRRATPARVCKLRPPNLICRPNSKNRDPKLDPNSSKKLNLGLYFLRGPHQTHSICTALSPFCASAHPAAVAALHLRPRGRRLRLRDFTRPVAYSSAEVSLRVDDQFLYT
jgi:hypothetical protein